MGLREWWRRLGAPDDAFWAEPVQYDEALEGVQEVATCTDRAKVRVHGTVTSVEIRPHDGACSLVARLSDGSGELDVMWMGRRSIPGIGVGTMLTVEGRVCVHDKRRTMFNPRYELACV